MSSGGVVMALDFGSARTGVAVSDPTGTVVRPLAAIETGSSSERLATIARMVDELNVERLVVGLPVPLAGGESTQTARSRSFAALLRQHVDIPVDLHDERFTTKLAEAHPISTDAAPDSLAACHLLESYLRADQPLAP